MIIKTSEASGIVLDWLVAKAEDYPETHPLHFISMWKSEGHGVSWTHASSDEAVGGPIIDQEKISVVRGNDLIFPKGNENGDTSEPLYLARYSESNSWTHGQTQLIAAMRCYVASKLGDEVEVPDEIAVNM